MLSKTEPKYIFLVFGMTRPGIENWFPGPLAITLLIRPNWTCWNDKISYVFPKLNVNSLTAIRTHILLCYRIVRQPLHYKGLPQQYLYLEEMKDSNNYFICREIKLWKTITSSMNDYSFVNFAKNRFIFLERLKCIALWYAYDYFYLTSPGDSTPQNSKRTAT